MYQITIEKVEKKEAVGREYQKIADSGNERDGGPRYAYVEFPSQKVIETTILRQSVEELDLAAVIKAVNNL